MISRAFLNFGKEKIEEGSSRYAMSIKQMVLQQDEALFKALDFNNDQIFLEPLLFAYFSSEKPEISLRQILFGHIIPSKRFDTVKVFSNSAGIVFLPRIGYFKIKGPVNQQLDLLFDSKSGKYTFVYNTNVIRHTFKKSLYLEGTNIEINQFSVPIIEPYFRDEKNNVTAVDLKRITLSYATALNTAVNIFKQNYPGFFNSLNLVTKCLVLFKSSCANSFATFSVHGAGFLNVPEKANEAFFIEDIAHQCGHVIFTTLTHEKQQFFAVDPDSSLRKFNLRAGEHRSVYVAFHGLFTEAVMSEAFFLCLKNKVFTGARAHEIKGRFAYIFVRYLFDMESLNHESIFTPDGLFIYNEIKKKMLSIYYRYGCIIKEYDLSNQPYTFSYDKFLRKNSVKR